MSEFNKIIEVFERIKKERVIESDFMNDILEKDLESAKKLILDMTEEELNGIHYGRRDAPLLQTIFIRANDEIINELCKFIVPKLKIETLYKTSESCECITALELAIDDGYTDLAEILVTYMFPNIDSVHKFIPIEKICNIVKKIIKGLRGTSPYGDAFLLVAIELCNIEIAKMIEEKINERKSD